MSAGTWSTQASAPSRSTRSGNSSTTAQAPPDAWLGGTNYDPSTFYTRATNTHDHSERIGFKVRPDLYSVIKGLVSSGDYPDYSSDADFYRDAAVHRLHWLRDNGSSPEMREKLQSSIDLIEFEEKIGAHEQERKKLVDLDLRTKTLMSDMVQAQDWEPLVSLIEEMEEWADLKREPIRSSMLSICKDARGKIPAGYLNMGAA